MKAIEVINLLKDIPAEKFIDDGRFTNYVDSCCVLGHINRLTSTDPTDYTNAVTGLIDHKDGEDFREQSIEYLHKKYEYPLNDRICIGHVNNYDHINGYNEPVIKDRVMHLLNDMVEGGY